MEVDDQDLMAFADYIKNKIPETFDLANAPDEAKNDYTDILQRINNYVEDQQQASSVDQGVAAPA